MITGFADYSDIRRDHPARRTATWHMVLNLAAFVAYAASASSATSSAFPSPTRRCRRSSSRASASC